MRTVAFLSSITISTKRSKTKTKKTKKRRKKKCSKSSQIQPTYQLIHAYRSPHDLEVQKPPKLNLKAFQDDISDIIIQKYQL